jgi:hypothetical protein
MQEDEAERERRKTGASRFCFWIDRETGASSMREYPPIGGS